MTNVVATINLKGGIDKTATEAALAEFLSAVFRKIDSGYTLHSLTVTDGCAGGQTLQVPVVGDPVVGPTQQHGQFGDFGPAAKVHLVHNNELPSAFRTSKVITSSKR